MKNERLASKKTINTSLHVLILRENKYFVAYCPALELSSYGDTEEDARSAFEDALAIFLTESIKSGTLERFLLKQGWRLQLEPMAKYEPPKLVRRNYGRGVLKTFREDFQIPAYR